MDSVEKHRNRETHAQQLRSDLDRLSRDGRLFLQRWRLREELRAACSVALLGLFVLPLIALLMQWTCAALGFVPISVSVWTILGLAAFGPFFYVLGRLIKVYFRYHPRRHSALALYDAELKTHDRLVIADEFLGDELSASTHHNPVSMGFRQAAVADADRYSRSALSAALSPLVSRQLRVRPISWLGVPAAILVGALLYTGIGETNLATKINKRALSVALEESIAPELSEERRAAARKIVRRLQERQKDLQLAAIEKQEVAPTKSRKARKQKGAEGQSNSGNAALAQAMSTSSEAAGEPSGQKNASKLKKPEDEKPEEEDTKEAKKKKKKKEQQKTTQMAMSATSGEGKMSMSNASPAEFDMPEEEDRAGAGVKQEGTDEDAEDEDEEEKSNAVSKPSLNDRKAPVNRELNPGGGKRPPDRIANGRGPPGQRKKTRGVPSMILGVPLPDRVQGMPNPGRSKVTQEEAKPKQESHPALEAQLRLARTDAIGQVEHANLLPWMQSLVERYFVTIWQKADSEEPSMSSLSGFLDGEVSLDATAKPSP